MRGLLRQYQMPLLGVVAVVAFVLAAYFPHARRMSDLKAEVQSMRADLADREARLRATTAAQQSGTNGTVPFTEAVPSDPQMGEFLESLDRLAREAGLLDRSTEPEEPVDGAQVSWLPITMTFRGSFDSVYGFIDNLEQLPRVARVQELTIESSMERDALLTSSLTMHVYYKRS